MPAWATVTLTLGVAALGIAGTLAATMLQLRHTKRERERDAMAARRARAAAVLGRVRTLLADMEPARIGINAHPKETPALLDASRNRWQSLRDELSIFAAADEDPAVVDAAAKLDVAVSNTLSRVAWHAQD